MTWLVVAFVAGFVCGLGCVFRAIDFYMGRHYRRTD